MEEVVNGKISDLRAWDADIDMNPHAIYCRERSTMALAQDCDL